MVKKWLTVTEFSFFWENKKRETLSPTEVG